MMIKLGCSAIVLLSLGWVNHVVAQNVGIGQPNPSSRLEIRGNGISNATSALNVTDNNGNTILYAADDQRVGLRTTMPDASAVLDITATDAGILIPRLTDGQMNGIALPATGLLIYNSTQNRFFYYDGVQWVDLVGSGNQGSGSGDPTLLYTIDGF